MNLAKLHLIYLDQLIQISIQKMYLLIQLFLVEIKILDIKTYFQK